MQTKIKPRTPDEEIKKMFISIINWTGQDRIVLGDISAQQGRKQIVLWIAMILKSAYARKWWLGPCYPSAKKWESTVVIGGKWA